MVETLTTEKLKERELIRLFEPIEGEIGLIKASAKFNYTINKPSENQTKVILSFAEDTEQLVHILKERIKLLLDATS
jgi:hypothetical protein